MAGAETVYLQRSVEDPPSLPTRVQSSPEAPEPSLVPCLASFRAAQAADENILFFCPELFCPENIFSFPAPRFTCGEGSRKGPGAEPLSRESRGPPSAPGDEVFGEAWLWAHLESMRLEREMMQNTLFGARNCCLEAWLPLPRSGRLQAGNVQEPIR